MRTKQMPRRSVLAVVVVSLAACSPAVTLTRMNAAPVASGRAPEAVRVYSTQRPRCPYEELATISGRRRTVFNSADDVMREMKRKAASAGGDAIIGLGTADRVVAANANAYGGVDVEHNTVYSGTVVR